MKSLLIYEILLVVWALTASPWLFLLALGYVIVSHDRLNKAQEMVLAAEEEEKKLKELNINSKEVARRLEETPELFLPYKNCIIEVYGGLKDGSVRIMQPSGKDLGKEFASIDDAIREIDFVYPFFKEEFKRNGAFRSLGNQARNSLRDF